MGHMLGKAQRYVADVKAEVNRSIELEELKKMKTQFEDAARNVEQTVNKEVNAASAEFNATVGTDWSAGQRLRQPSARRRHVTAAADSQLQATRRRTGASSVAPRRSGTSSASGIRTKAQSGAARVARFRPPGLKRP